MEETHLFSRAELLLGKDGLERLKQARVAVFGIGGSALLRRRHWRVAALGISLS